VGTLRSARRAAPARRGSPPHAGRGHTSTHGDGPGRVLVHPHDHGGLRTLSVLTHSPTSAAVVTRLRSALVRVRGRCGGERRSQRVRHCEGDSWPVGVGGGLDPPCDHQRDDPPPAAVRGGRRSRLTSTAPSANSTACSRGPRTVRGLTSAAPRGEPVALPVRAYTDCGRRPLPSLPDRSTKPDSGRAG
jgi:hypothetical protein